MAASYANYLHYKMGVFTYLLPLSYILKLRLCRKLIEKADYLLQQKSSKTQILIIIIAMNEE